MSKPDEKETTDKAQPDTEPIASTQAESQPETEAETKAATPETEAEADNLTDKDEKTAEEPEAEQADEANDPMRDKYLRLFAEFDNYKKRTSREKIEWTTNANEKIIKPLLTVIDDFERALLAADQQTEEVKAFVQGFELIYQKLMRALEQKGLKPIDSFKGKEMDTDLHEAITQIPAPHDDLKGKIVDEVEKGYMLNNKVIRFTKVVVGN